MTSSQKLATEQYLTSSSEPEFSDAMVPSTAARRSSAPLVSGAMMFAVLAMVVAGAAAVWLFQPGGETKSNTAADFFLWISGSDLTWEQYQAQQLDRGNQRLDEKEYDWTQQVLNDAYSR